MKYRQMAISALGRPLPQEIVYIIEELTESRRDPAAVSTYVWRVDYGGQIEDLTQSVASLGNPGWPYPAHSIVEKASQDAVLQMDSRS